MAASQGRGSAVCTLLLDTVRPPNQAGIGWFDAIASIPELLATTNARSCVQAIRISMDPSPPAVICSKTGADGVENPPMGFQSILPFANPNRSLTEYSAPHLFLLMARDSASKRGAKVPVWIELNRSGFLKDLNLRKSTQFRCQWFGNFHVSRG